MTKILYKTRKNAMPGHKRPHVFFTCHPDDFPCCFDTICNDILKTHDCIIFYTEDMNDELDKRYVENDLGQINLLVVPVTKVLLTQPSRAISFDFHYAESHGIAILPIIMEPNWDEIFNGKLKKRFYELFGERQYINYHSHDLTAISYSQKLKSSLDRILSDDKVAEMVREEFAAYIFLSYRKADRHYANQLMKFIHSYPEYRDVAIWYDEFLTLSENFRTKIEAMIKESDLFTLLVTPRILEYVGGEPNYVMKYEYPFAKRAVGIGILPAKMEKTDAAALRSEYEGIPECIDPNDIIAFRKRLEKELNMRPFSTNNDPKHMYLIGLAYLDGIDVEINKEAALELIMSAAEAEIPEAMEKLYWMYDEGKSVLLDYAKATEWAGRLFEYNKRVYGMKNGNTLKSMNYLATSYGKQNKRNEALALFKESYEIHCSFYGEKHADSIYTLGKLAYTYSRLKKYSEACKLYEKAYRLRLELLGEKDPDTIRSLSNLASSYNKNGQYQDAYELYTQLYDLSYQILGEDHYRTVRTKEKLLLLRQKMNA